jgi:hypothetical protein
MRSWFKGLQKSKPVRQASRSRSATFRPMLERLEDRLVPSINPDYWTGASGVDNNWSTNANWDDGTGVHLAPTSTSDVVFDSTHAGSHTTSIVDAAFTSAINSLNIASSWSGATLTVNSALTVNNGATISANDTINGTSGMTLKGTSTWSTGTLASSGTTTVAASATLNITSTVTLDTATLANLGIISWTAGNIYGQNGAQILNESGATFDITAGTYFYWPNTGAHPTFDNQSGATLKADSTSSFYDWIFTNEGTIDAETGFTFDVHHNYYGGGTATLNDGSKISGPGTTEATSAVAISGTITVTSGATFQLPSGALTGTGAFTGAGQFAWSGGELGGGATTDVTIDSAFHLNITNGVTLDQATLENKGNVTWTAGTITGQKGAQILNESGGLFDIKLSTYYVFLWSNVGSHPTFDNQLGATLKADGSSSFYDWLFTNEGTVDAETSTTLNLSYYYNGGGSATLNDGSQFTGAGITEATSAVAVNGTITVGLGATFELAVGTGSNLTGTATFTGTGQFLWVGGTWSGASTDVTIAAGFHLNISGGSPTLDGATLENKGTVTWNSGYIYGQNGAQIKNESGATFDIAAGNYFYWPNTGAHPTFDNQSGATLKADSSSSFYDWIFTNEGTIDAETGFTFDLQHNFFGGGSATLNDGSQLTGPGVTEATNSIAVSGTITVASGATFQLPQGVLTGTATFTGAGQFVWSSGKLGGGPTTDVTIASAFHLNITSGVTLDQATLENKGIVTWTAGNLTGQNGAQILNESGGLFDIAPSAGVFYWSNLPSRPSFDNQVGATLKADTNSSFYDWVFTNEGTIDAEASTTLNLSYYYYGGGSVTLNDGSQFTGAGITEATSGVTVNGTITVGPGATFKLAAGTGSNLTGVATFTGTGQFLWAGGTWTGAATDVTIAVGFHLNISGGSPTLDGATLENKGTVTWNSGIIYGQNGAQIKNESGATFDIAGAGTYFYWPDTGNHPSFDNQASATLKAESTSAFDDWIFTNEGTIDAESGATFDVQRNYFGGGSATLNDGSMITGPGVTEATNSVAVSGIVTVSTNATFQLPQGALTGTGTFTGAGQFLWTGGTLGGGSTTDVTFAAGFHLNINGGTLYLDQSTLENKGIATWNSGGIATSRSASILNESGGLFDIETNNNAQLYWINTGGNPTFDNQAGATLRRAAVSGSTTFFEDVKFSNEGTIDVRGGETLNLYNYYGGGSFSNFAGTTLTGGTYLIAGHFIFPGADIATDAAAITLDGAGSLITPNSSTDAMADLQTITAAGSLTLKNGRLLTTANHPLANAGSVLIGASSGLTLTGAGDGYTQSAGTTEVEGTLTVDSSTSVTINGGRLDGGGTISGAVIVNSGGHIGGEAGVPSILSTGNLTLNNGAIYDAQLNGSTAGGVNGYDQINVAGAVNLTTPTSPTLNATLGYIPNLGDKLFIIANDGTDPVNGIFAGLPEGAGLSLVSSSDNISYSFVIHYTGDAATQSTTGGNDVVLVCTSNAWQIPAAPLQFHYTYRRRLAFGGIQLADSGGTSTAAGKFTAEQLIGASMTDGSVQATVNASSSTVLVAGILARLQSNGDAYAAILTHDGLAQIVLFHAGTNSYTVLGSVTASNVAAMQFTIVGSTLSLYLNGSPSAAVTVNNSVLSAGGVGMFAEGPGGIISNFTTSL